MVTSAGAVGSGIIPPVILQPTTKATGNSDTLSLVNDLTSIVRPTALSVLAIIDVGYPSAAGSEAAASAQASGQSGAETVIAIDSTTVISTRTAAGISTTVLPPPAEPHAGGSNKIISR